VHVHITMSIWW